MHYEFASDVLGRVASPVFERITDSLVDAFVRRADELGDAIPALAPVVPKLHPGSG
jgi:ribosome-associated toxin RatA of RatAB toxin-antitoxin module